MRLRPRFSPMDRFGLTCLITAICFLTPTIWPASKGSGSHPQALSGRHRKTSRISATGESQMKAPALKPSELDMVQAIFRRHPEVTSATLFGSRAKGTHTERSDVDLAVAGDVAPLRAEAIAAELDELPLPYLFEVQPLEQIH